jgi:AcrR family transcriptional regulator
VIHASPVRAKSVSLADTLRKRPRRSTKAAPAAMPAPRKRLKAADRREQILAKAADFFAEYGLTAQTRALAAACGVSQRLLYRVFPNKAALLEAVYEREIVGPFKAVWLVQLADRSKPVETRLVAFYRDYCAAVLTRRWLRLFLYASLAEVDMAPSYIADIVTRMLETVVTEAAHERGLALPRDRSRIHEIGWTLHGAISHLAIRREVYANRNAVSIDEVVAMHIAIFMGGLPAALAASTRPARAAKAAPH